MLEECKNVCDYLIVGLQTDPSIDRESKNRPVMSMVERHTMLNAVKYVDEIRTYETEDDLYSLLKQLVEITDTLRLV
jgi:glycerol-3-phosphate cytidylyltransferase